MEGSYWPKSVENLRRMKNGKLIFVVLVLLLAGALYFFDLSGPVILFFDWLLSAAAAFVAAIVEFITWVLS
jgi:hypothetical protein